MQPAELAKLDGLLSLRELYLPGPIWNPGGGNEDSTAAFKALATLTGVEKLYFGWHYNAQINIADRNIAQLAHLTELQDFRCSQCRLANANLSSFTKLRNLDLSYTAFSDKALEGLAALKDLRRLNLRDTMVTDEGLEIPDGSDQPRGARSFGNARNGQGHRRTAQS